MDQFASSSSTKHRRASSVSSVETDHAYAERYPPGASSASSANKRVSKACEFCRSRKRRCDGLRPCGNCVRLERGHECRIRLKARPNRVVPVPAQAPSHKPPMNLSAQVEAYLQRWLEGCGTYIDLTLHDIPPLTPLPTSTTQNQTLPDGQPLSPVSPTARFYSHAQPNTSHNPGQASASFPHHLLALPGSPASWSETLDTCTKVCTHHLDIFPPGRIAQVTHTFLHDPNALDTDEMILVLALLAVGRQIEMALAGAGAEASAAAKERAGLAAREMEMEMDIVARGYGALGDGTGMGGPGEAESGEREDVVLFLLAMRMVDDWGQCSALALGALHLLHFWALRHGGKAEFEQVLERMNEHCLQLGLHQKSTVALYPAEESGGRLFYLTMYKDTWYSTLTHTAPSFALGSFDPTWQTPTPSIRFGHKFEESPLSIAFTLLENEAMGIVSRPGGYHSDGDGAPTDYSSEGRGRGLGALWDLESRLMRWGRDCAVERRGQSPFLAFALIRYHWLRMLLRFPFVPHPGGPSSDTTSSTHQPAPHRASHAGSSSALLPSLAVLSRSSLSLLRTYLQLSSTVLFIPKYADTRRISTAAYIALICHLEGELDGEEMRGVNGVVCELYGKSLGVFGPVRGCWEAWRGVMRLVGIDVPIEEMRAKEQDEPGTDNFRFDFSLPPPPEQGTGQSTAS